MQPLINFHNEVNVKLKFIGMVFVIAAFFLTTVSRAQGVKIGYVNSAKILQEYSEAQNAQKKIDAQGKAWQDSLEHMSTSLQKDYDDFQKVEMTLTDQAKRDRREFLVQEEQRGVQFKQDKFGQNGELAAFSDSILTPVKKKVMKVIEEVAKAQHLTFVFDRNELNLVLLYGEKKYDYTAMVIDYLTREQP
jgi:outer membrane protein